ncbi:MAG: autotransporter domain-containing protein, partial [Chlorobiaceae bacterium]|nr:autotransporter domain-containing protein [Chlorobiaceae bacterium]
IGGQNGVVGQGGDVSVTNSGSIIINGDNSVGIFAQSVGGGGGMVMPGGGATSIALQNGGSGNGGSVEITNTAGSIIVTGPNSIALYSQSVGGGGGAVGLVSDPPGQIGAFLFSSTAKGSGSSDKTIIKQTGNLIATAQNSVGLVAQSVARDGNGDITININNPAGLTSLIEGGSDQGAGVFILDGAGNTLNNDGIITTISGIDGFGIRATKGSDKIVNNRLIIGSVDLGDGANAFFNNQDKWFKSGETVYLGAGNLLTNHGYVTPGDWNRVLTTRNTGNYLQSDTGVFCTDLDLKNQIADKLDITGTGDVSGTIPINLVDPVNAAGYALPGDHVNVLMSAAMGMQHGTIDLQAPDTAVSTYSLDYPNATDIDLNYTIDYSPSGLTWNQHSVGYAVNRIQTAQISPDFRPIAAALFFQPDIGTLASIYDSLSGEGVISLQQSSLYSSDMFLKTIGNRTGQWVFNNAFGQSESKEDSSPVKEGGYKPIPKEGNLWMTSYFGNGGVTGNSFIGSANSSYDGICFTAGFDKQITRDAIIGFAVGKGTMDMTVPERETSGGVDFLHLGSYAALRGEHLYVKGALAYDQFDNAESRHASIPGLYMDTPDGKGIAIAGYDEYLKSSFASSAVSGDIEIGSNHRNGNVMITPFAGLSFSVQNSDGFEELKQNNEASEIGLSFKEQETISMPFRLGLQLSLLKKLSDESSLAFSARGQWIHEFRQDRTMHSEFLAAPGFEFPIIAAQPEENAFRADINMNLVVDRNLSFYGGLTTDTVGSMTKYSGMAGWRITW